MPSRNKKFQLGGIMIGVLAILAWVSFSLFSLRLDGELHIYFLDVGQGDSILIRTPKGDDILIDGGPDEKVLSELGEVLPFSDRDIELMILTHPDSDHVTGLCSVLERYQVKETWLTGVEHSSSVYAEFNRLLANENGVVDYISGGEKKTFDQQVELEVLFPFESLKNQKLKDLNDSSIICQMDYQQKTFLFTGDTSETVEKELLDNNILEDVDLLKVSHHGSRSATSAAFLEVALPELAIISCGKDNRFNHPHQEVLENLELINCQVKRTDLEGRIEVQVERGKILIK